MSKVTNELCDEQLTIGWQLFHESEFDKALALCKELELVYSEELNVNYLAALSYFYLGDMTSAADQLRLALAKDLEERTKGYIYFWFGRIHERHFLGNDENPLHDSKLATKYFNDSYATGEYPQDLIMKIYYSCPSDEKKAELLSLAVNKFPDVPYFYVILSDLYKKYGDKTNRWAILEEA